MDFKIGDKVSFGAKIGTVVSFGKNDKNIILVSTGDNDGILYNFNKYETYFNGLKHYTESVNGYREEAFEKLKHNNVSAATMDVWIAGYIAGREENDRSTYQKYEAKEFLPEGEYISDGYGYTQFKDL